MTDPMEIRILRTRVVVPVLNGDAIHEKEVLQQYREGRWVDVLVATETIHMPFGNKDREGFDNE